MRNLSWEYMACLTDGEGSIFIAGRASSRQVNINWTQCQKNAWWLDHVKHFLVRQGIAVKDVMRTTKEGFTHRSLDVYDQVSTRKCIEQMLPWLILKEKRAKEALAFLDAKKVARVQRESKCKHGHARIKKNIYVHPKTGKRSCLVCRQLRARGLDPTVPGYAP
jgi:hypothetical protein